MPEAIDVIINDDSYCAGTVFWKIKIFSWFIFNIVSIIFYIIRVWLIGGVLLIITFSNLPILTVLLLL